jgi:hypothetical protein
LRVAVRVGAAIAVGGSIESSSTIAVHGAMIANFSERA